jgi:hypothetical protein
VISDPWIDRSPLPARVLKRDEVERSYANNQRALKRAAGVCINGPLAGGVGKKGVVHGTIVKSGKCQRCLDVYARSA